MSQFALLGKRRFAPFFWTQALGAFNDNAFRNALVMLFSSQDAKTLVSRDGKEKLRSDALDEIRKIVAERTQGATLDAVYFTSFVMQ